MQVDQRFGMCTLVWGPLGQGLLTGRVRKNKDNDLRRAGMARHLTDERRVDAVEQFVQLAADAGLPMTHLAMAFTTAHPGVTSALLGARTMDHLDDLLAGLDATLTDDVLDRIDEIVPPGTDVGALDQAYRTPALDNPGLRRRPLATRAMAASGAQPPAGGRHLAGCRLGPRPRSMAQQAGRGTEATGRSG